MADEEHAPAWKAIEISTTKVEATMGTFLPIEDDDKALEPVSPRQAAGELANVPFDSW